jgi:hypothetical protein
MTPAAPVVVVAVVPAFAAGGGGIPVGNPVASVAAAAHTHNTCIDPSWPREMLPKSATQALIAAVMPCLEGQQRKKIPRHSDDFFLSI